MRRYPWSVILLAGLLILAPFAFASTFEVWTEGVYDAESDGLVHALKSAEGAIDRAQLVRAGHVPVVASLAPIIDDSAAPAVILPARPCRAPPGLLTLRSR